MPGRGRFKDLDAWPEPDPTRWRRGLSPASLFDDTGHSTKWRPATAIKVGRAYATYLNWLDLTGQLKTDEPPEQRITPARLDNYCKYLAASVKPRWDPGFIRRRSYCYPKRGDRLAKRARMQEQAALLQLVSQNGSASRRPKDGVSAGVLFSIMAGRIFDWDIGWRAGTFGEAFCGLVLACRLAATRLRLC